MPKTDKRVDAYIAKAPDFAKPILTTIRETVHEACPDCEETLKWSAPAFMHNGIVLVMGAFKEHAAVSFWKGALILEDGVRVEGTAGQFGKLRSVADLPPKKKLVGYIKKAVELNATGTTVPKRTPKPKKALAMPDYFIAAIKKNKKALAGYEKFSPSQQREYIEWITDAKGEDTRMRRVTQAVEWMAEGKPRNWKYM
ncbi:MAG: hypothetical protein JWM41_4085 [Gemmatimonadetes bacterium]|nr:hypothetical protein [Gemmatimonadota bacterium]